MRSFPHSLIDKAKVWYLDQPILIMTNWDSLEEKFLDKIFPCNKFMEAKTSIFVFSQSSKQTLFEVGECYKFMLQKCPNHSFDDLAQIHIFHNRLQPQPKILLDAIAANSLMSKSTEDAIAIIKGMTLNDHQDQYNRGRSQRKDGII